MTDADPIETEIKLLIEPRAVAKLRAHPLLAGPPRIEALRSVYFDTEERALARAGFSLRVRTRARRHVQTVKNLGDHGLARGEWESPLAKPRPEPGALARTPALAVLDSGDVLRPIFTTTVRRATWIWRQGSDRVEISLDEGQVRAGARRARLLEVELELKSGDPAILFELVGRLRRDVALRLCLESKAERGYRLASAKGAASVDAAAVGAAPARIGPGISTAEAFRRIARAGLAQAVANSESLRRGRPPEAVHQMRVGLRRLRAAIAAFGPILEGPGRDAVSADLAWLAGELDQARDEDVFEKATIRPAADRAGDLGGADAFEALGQHLGERREAAYDRALAAIHSSHADGLIIDVLRWVEVGDWACADAPGRREARDREIGAFAADALDQRMKAVRKHAGRLESLDAGDRHRLRIKAKKLRYAAEFLAPAFGHGDAARRFLSRLAALQDSLGELNDIAVARRKALGEAGGEPSLAYAAGRAVGWRERGEARLVGAAAKAAGKLCRSRPFWRP